jgi:hypothetical protein
MNFSCPVKAGELVIQNPRQHHQPVRLQECVAQRRNTANCTGVEHSLKHGRKFTRPGVPGAMFLSSTTLSFSSSIEHGFKGGGANDPESKLGGVLIRASGARSIAPLPLN